MSGWQIPVPDLLASLLIFILLLSSILPFSPLIPNRSRQMAALSESGSAWGFFLLKGSFFLPLLLMWECLVSSKLGLEPALCKMPWDNFVVIWRYTNKDWLIDALCCDHMTQKSDCKKVLRAGKLSKLFANEIGVEPWGQSSQGWSFCNRNTYPEKT